MMKIQSANVRFNESGTPVADAFDDVYFSNDDGLAETNYVFLRGNNLTERWERSQSQSFCIAETGFGTGLNCLQAIAEFNQFRQQQPQAKLKTLHLLSCEKYPLSKADLSAALAKHPGLSEYADMLVTQYPIPLAGVHRLFFPHVTLDLWLGDVEDVMAQWHASGSGLVDAWFLDGFAPSKNPQMWTQSLFDNMARLSRQGATLATFTAAGFVRRGLIEAGFDMQKHPGFGRKREMLRGELQTNPKVCAPRCALPGSQHIAVVGGGLAGANAAYALTQKGFTVTLLCEQQLASGASGNAQGGFYPQLHAQASYASRIQAHSYLFALHRYQAMLAKGFHFAHDWCGVLQLAFSEDVEKRQTKLLNNQVWPDELVVGLSPEGTSEKANIPLDYPALYFPDGGWISPPELVKALIKGAGEQGKLNLLEHTPVAAIRVVADGVTITAGDETLHFDHVVVATGAESTLIDSLIELPFRPVRGQVEYVPTQSPLGSLKAVICHKGYMTPAHQGRHALGSTYVRLDTDTRYREQEESKNKETHQKALVDTEWAEKLKFDQTGRASVRMALPDHQPIVGILPEQVLGGKVSILGALGSRGLTTAPLMSELLACMLTHQPLPLSRELVSAVSANRYMST